MINDEKHHLWDKFINGHLLDFALETKSREEHSPAANPSRHMIYEPLSEERNDLTKPLSWHDTLKIKALKTFIDLENKDTLNDLFSQAIDQDRIQIPDILSDGIAECRESLYFDGANFLLFRSKKGIFFICQLRRAIDAIVIPTAQLTIGRSLSSVEKTCSKFLDDIFKRIFIGPTNPIENGTTRFGGLIVNQALPYHYFYDVLPGFFWLYERNKDRLNKTYFAGFDAGFYLPLSRLFEIGKGDLHLNFHEPSSLTYKAEEFYINCLRNEKFQRHKLNERADEELKVATIAKTNFITRRISTPISSLRDKKVIWFGILAGKRYWREQCEAIINIIGKLNNHATKYFFVFDGLTLSEFDRNIRTGEQHRGIINKIISQCRLCGNEYHILNTATALEKLFWASKVDFFLTDSATSSLYVSRIFGAPGVCHSQKKARIIGHTHKNAWFIPAEYVTDLAPNDEWIHSPYSIPVKLAVDFFMEKFMAIMGDEK